MITLLESSPFCASVQALIIFFFMYSDPFCRLVVFASLFNSPSVLHHRTCRHCDVFVDEIVENNMFLICCFSWFNMWFYLPAFLVLNNSMVFEVFFFYFRSRFTHLFRNNNVITPLRTNNEHPSLLFTVISLSFGALMCFA